MSHIVVAYPKFSTGDATWIEAFREKYDKEYVSVIDAHYTLVFPTDKALTTTELTQHIEEQAPSAFNTRCRVAQVVYNQFIDKWHVFLVPEEGYADIERLHDRLYSGPLKDQRHPTEPFIPHIGIATCETREECEALAADLNQRELDVQAPLVDLDLCAYDGKRVTTIAKVPLL